VTPAGNECVTAAGRRAFIKLTRHGHVARKSMWAVPVDPAAGYAVKYLSRIMHALPTPWFYLSPCSALFWLRQLNSVNGTLFLKGE